MKSQARESGIVSIVVCLIIMVIISLITITFATLSRREQRQALDKQLSTQAFYAAESGINDALKAIHDKTLLTDITSCDETEQEKISTSRVIDGSNIAHTCVFVDQTPPQIVDTVKVDTSSVFKISAPGLVRLDFKWENDDKTQAQSFPGGMGLVPYNSWNGGTTPGILRIELIPVTNSRAGSANTIDVFGFPTSSNSKSTHNAADTANNGEILTGGCTAGGGCNVSLTGLSGEYYLRMIAIYDPLNVTITGRNAANNPVSFTGAQAEIDATGKSSDVLRRVKVYKSLINDKSGVPDYTLSVADDLCKRLRSNSYQTTSDSAVSHPLCAPIL